MSGRGHLSKPQEVACGGTQLQAKEQQWLKWRHTAGVLRAVPGPGDASYKPAAAIFLDED